MESEQKKFRIAEIFGPTIQGEGRHAGVPCHFVRFGGCDFRCSWCDTPHAVLPEQVMQLNRMSVEEIVEVIDDLSSDPDWIVLSGGNPALLDLGYLVNSLHKAGYKVMVETQGTVFQLWLLDCDEVCISPKPPSSGTIGFEPEFMLAVEQNPKFYMKIVVFDEEDYDWASDMHRMYPKFDTFLSVGNEDPSLPTVGNPHAGDRGIHLDVTRGVVLDKTRWLFEKVANDPRMRNVRVMPQLHTLAWGNIRGR